MTKINISGNKLYVWFYYFPRRRGWLLRKDLGRDGLYLSLIAGQIALVLMFSTSTFKFLRYILPVLGLPVVIFMFIKSRISFSKGLRRYASIVLLFVFSAALFLDLVYSLQKVLVSISRYETPRCHTRC